MPPLSTAGLMRDDLPPLSPSAGTWYWCPGLKHRYTFNKAALLLQEVAGETLSFCKAGKIMTICGVC